MKKLPFLFLFAALAFQLNAQNLDSLYNEFIKIRLGTDASGNRVAVSEEEPVKCGFGIVNEVKLNYDKFDPKQKAVLSSLLARPQTQTSIVSPSGFFRIHYDTIGTNKPGYDLNQLAIALDSSYNFEVNILGYPPPPKDNGQGDDDKYDVYVVNLETNYYGNTYDEDQLTSQTYTSYIEMDNNFSGYYTQGINAARVTAAHELHHAIQMGNYIFRTTDRFYHEITSTAMEEFVYDDVNDYYGYLRSFFESTYRTIINQNGYNLAIWNIFLKDRFGFGILKRIWELMRTERALYAMRDAIAEYGSTFKAEFNTYGQWLYFTKERAQAGKYFEEAANYPKVKPTIELILPQQSMELSTEPVSTNFLFFYNNTDNGIDTLITIITNADVTNGVAKPDSLTKLSYAISTNGGSGYKQIFDGYYSKLDSDFPLLLVESNILNKSAGPGHFATVDYAFPQPFKYSNDGFIYFPADGVSATAEIYIYSVDMNLVFSGSEIVDHNYMTVKWNARDKSGSRLGSGIYFYYVKTDTLNKKGKFVILND